jgi:hypothetical protein
MFAFIVEQGQGFEFLCSVRAKTTPFLRLKVQRNQEGLKKKFHEVLGHLKISESLINRCLTCGREGTSLKIQSALSPTMNLKAAFKV